MRSELTMAGLEQELRVLRSWLLPCPDCGAAVTHAELGLTPVSRDYFLACLACKHEVSALSREGLISAWNGERKGNPMVVDGEQRVVTPPRPAPSDEAETPSEASLEARLAAIEGKLDRILDRMPEPPQYVPLSDAEMDARIKERLGVNVLPREAASSSTRASDSEPGSKRNPRHS